MISFSPRGKQEEVLALPARGHAVILGAAGSGKTMIAMLRAYHLANLAKGGNVLLVTYNNALIKYMRALVDVKPNNLTVENYHKFARGYLHYRGKIPASGGICESSRKMNYIELSINALRKEYPSESTLKRSKEFFEKEIVFIQKFGFSSFDEYKDSSRIGRAGAHLTRENRKWIYMVYKQYLKLREQDGFKFDWDDMARYVYEELQNDRDRRKYQHVILDEGQDFSPMMIKSLVEATATEGSFSFFGDVAQQIYGSRYSWRDSGVDVSRIWRFDVNYRNPAAVIAFAKDITESRYWRSDSDMVETTVQVAEGPSPVLIKFCTRSNEIDWVIKMAIETAKSSLSVIVCRNWSDVYLFKEFLLQTGASATIIEKDTVNFLNTGTVYISTYHSTKGLEFDNVFIPLLTADKMPDQRVILASATDEDAYAEEIRLLYVAVTRCRYGLYMTYSGILSKLFPATSANCNFFDEGDIK